MLPSSLLLRISLNVVHDVPPSLLLMSRLMYVPEDVPEIEKIRIAINSLPGARGGIEGDRRNIHGKGKGGNDDLAYISHFLHFFHHYPCPLYFPSSLSPSLSLSLSCSFFLTHSFHVLL